ncbi:AAA family ATPase [Glaciihabitans sp. UYNi722]|uniref:helix-turn-helix transcriptional regulator n=1 Tax=Glaciihabitans sp. UYNi722 TaxID=3156344 RepID=UPI003394385F
MQSAFGSTFLIGRESELATLRETFAAGLPGDTRTVVVAGEAGIGKTRLVAEFVESLPSQAVVAVGQCIDLGPDAPPYAPITGILRALLSTVGIDELIAAAGPSREALSVLLPELEELGGTRQDVRGGVEWVYDSVAVALENLARTAPLVLVAEDLHWSDQATLGLLRYLIRVLEHANILFVLTYRTDDVRRGHPLHAWLPELDRNRRVMRIDLGRFSRAQVRELADVLLGSSLESYDLGVLYDRSDGVPFLVEELVGFDGFENVDCFPSSLRGVLLSRYETLSEPTQRVVRLLAAGGARVEHELLVAVYDGDPEELDRAAREAVAASVIVIDDSAYEFRHALVRDAIHEELLPGERARFHSLYARALEERCDTDDTFATAMSYHWMVAHDLPAAFTASLKAMRHARGSYAYTAAARMGERALELWPQVPDAAELAACTRGELLADVAYILRNAGESDRAIALVEEAIAELAPGDNERLAALLRDKASYLANIGRSGSIDLLREALALLRDQPVSLLRATILGELAARLMLQAYFDEAVEVADAAFVEAEAVGSLPRMSVAANIRGTSLLSNGQISTGLDDLYRAGELGHGDDSARLRYWVNLSDSMNLLGRFDEAITLAEEGLERARLRGVERTKGAILLSNMIGPLFARGEWTRADDLLNRALALESPLGFSAPLQHLKLWSTLWGGDPESAERMLRPWRGQLGIEQQAQVRLAFARVAGEIALENGDVARAWSEVSGLIAPDHRGIPAYDLPLLMVAARVLATVLREGVDLGPEFDAVTADRDLRVLLARYEGWPTHPVFAAVFEAELGGPGRLGTNIDLWRRAVDAVESSNAPAFLRPWTRTRLAESLAAAGGRAEALIEAEHARSAAKEIGVGLILVRIDDLERRAGLHASQVSPVGSVPVLTDRERQVLALVAEGLSNRQIAEQLFISAKTASVHVSAILRKLGAATRTEAAYLAQQQPNGVAVTA